MLCYEEKFSCADQFLLLSAYCFAEFDTPLWCAYNFFRIISILQKYFMFYVIYVLALEGPSLKYAENILLIFTLCYNARPSCLIRLIRTICKYRNCSFLTGLITLLTDLSQAYHLGRIGTSKTSLQAPLSYPDRFTHSSVLRLPNLFPPCLGRILFVGYMYIHWFLWCSVIGGIFGSLILIKILISHPDCLWNIWIS